MTGSTNHAMRALTCALLLSAVSCTTPSCAREQKRPRRGEPMLGPEEPPTAAATPPSASEATREAAASPPPTGAPLSLEAARLYYAGPWLAAYEQFRHGDYKGARAAVIALRTKPPHTSQPTRDPLPAGDILLARCETALANWPAAAEAWQRAGEANPVLADWLGYQRARALYFAGATAQAKTIAAGVATDSIVGDDAALLAADITRGQGDAIATATAYRAYLDARPSGVRRAEARFRLAEALAAQAAPEPTREATGILRALWIAQPVGKWGEEARALLARVAPAAAAAPLTAQEQMTRGRALFDAMRNPQSAAAFETALASGGLSGAEACEASYLLGQSWFKERKRELAVPAFTSATKACEAAGNKDLWLRSAYQAGRSYVILGRAQDAAAMFAEAKAVDPSHSITDDAWLREAEAWALLGDEVKIEATLAAIPKQFPGGDMRAEALWRLGYRAWQQDRVDDAIRWWQQQIVAMPIDQNAWGEGQAQYWLGRALLRQGKRDQAIAQWQVAVDTYPLSYYALLALNRLREVAPKMFEAEVAAHHLDLSAPATAPTFAPRPEWQSAGFARALEFLRLGLGAEAEAELRKLGLTPPAGRGEITDDDQREKLWAIAFLYDRAERYATSHWPSRWHTLDYRRHWPDATWRAYWQVAYPLAFAPLIREHAAKNDIPFAMQIAIAREESSFDPQIESFANAVGLTQMILPTAKRFAKGTGITVTREALQDPTINVTLGARFLGFLFTYWDRFEPLVPASYNAGEGAIRRALKQRGSLATDEFIESIVTDETRLYSKRVLATYFTYAWLYEQRVPVIPNAIPPALLTK